MMTLPGELWYLCFTYLRPVDIANCLRLSKAFSLTITRLPSRQSAEVWESPFRFRGEIIPSRVECVVVDVRARQWFLPSESVPHLQIYAHRRMTLPQFRAKWKSLMDDNTLSFEQIELRDVELRIPSTPHTLTDLWTQLYQGGDPEDLSPCWSCARWRLIATVVWSKTSLYDRPTHIQVEEMITWGSTTPTTVPVLFTWFPKDVKKTFINHEGFRLTERTTTHHGQQVSVEFDGWVSRSRLDPTHLRRLVITDVRHLRHCWELTEFPQLENIVICDSPDMRVSNKTGKTSCCIHIDCWAMIEGVLRCAKLVFEPERLTQPPPKTLISTDEFVGISCWLPPQPCLLQITQRLRLTGICTIDAEHCNWFASVPIVEWKASSWSCGQIRWPATFTGLQHVYLHQSYPSDGRLVAFLKGLPSFIVLHVRNDREENLPRNLHCQVKTHLCENIAWY